MMFLHQLARFYVTAVLLCLAGVFIYAGLEARPGGPKVIGLLFVLAILFAGYLVVCRIV